MQLYSWFTIMVTPSVAIAAVINNHGITAAPTNVQRTSSVFGIDLFKGNASGPCQDASIELALDDAFVLNSTMNYCISTNNIPTTCIHRRMTEPYGVATTAQTYDATHGGLDTKSYTCSVIGFQKDACPADEGSQAQYHPADGTWSWDHATKIRDDYPGKLWSVLSFRMSCV